jgi:Lipocalin-like domain
MKRQFIAIALLMTGMSNAPPAPQTSRTLRENLVGTWRLIAARQRLSDGSVRADPQPGPRGVGYIMYDATGHMCVVLANPDRQTWKAPKAPTDAEVRSAFEGLVAYCGTYETNEPKHYVIHHVEADREPQVMGTDRARLATVNGDRLVLRPIDLPPGVKEWTVEWERVGVSTIGSRRP